MSKAEFSSTLYEREKEPKIFSNVFPSCAGRVHRVLDISRIFGILYQLYQLERHRESGGRAVYGI